MFNKNSAKQYLENTQEVYEKVKTRNDRFNEYLNEKIEMYKRNYDAKVKKSFDNMCLVIDKGLKNNFIKLTNNIYLIEDDAKISSSVRFFINDLSGMEAFIKIIEEYSGDYNLSITETNVSTNLNENILSGKEFTKWIENVKALFNMIHLNNDAAKDWNKEEVIYAYEHENEIVKSAIKKIYNKETIELTIKFDSKFTLTDILNDDEKPNKQPSTKEENDDENSDTGCLFEKEYDQIFNKIGDMLTNFFGIDNSENKRYYHNSSSYKDNYPYYYDSRNIKIK